MKRLAASVIGVAVLLGVGSLVCPAADGAAKCPISGKPAVASIFLEINGKEVPFCCESCPDAYKKRINLVAGDGEKKCPITGKATSAEQTVIQRRAQKVAFCCNNCPKGFAKKNKFEIKDVKPTRCPISGGPAKDGDGTSLIVNGNKVFFCCANCPKAYLKKLGVEDHSEKCAISGKAANPDTAQIFVRSEEIGFCCGDCKKNYVAKNFKDGIFVGGAGPKSTEPKAPAKELKRIKI